MIKLFSLFVLLLIHPLQILGTACSDACNSNYTTGETVTFCSSTGVTYTTKVSALQQRGFSSGCYGLCGIAVLHVGPCGCPNDCFVSTANGECVDDKCECNQGWGGEDCSLIECPSSCSGHGTCTHKSSAGGDICKCDAGWTSHDCSVPIPQYFQQYPYGSLPLGELPGVPYYQNDEYNDVHPFFNYSTIATVRITVSEANLIRLLDPLTIYQTEYMDAKLNFYNGVISKSSKILFRAKGLSSRLNVKKSWNVKFPKGETYKNLKGFSLKSHVGDRQISTQVIWEIYRAQKVKTYRHSHAQLYINNFFYGSVSLEERIDDAWVESRYNINPNNSANLWKISPYNLEYLGDTAEIYQNYTITLFNGNLFHPLEQEEGNGSWDDIVGLIKALNSSDETAVTYLQKKFNLRGLIRAWALETALMNGDSSLSTGNNYFLLDSKEGNQIKWEFIPFDFDSALIPLDSFFAPFLGLSAEQINFLAAAFHFTPCISPPADTTNLTADFIMSSNPYIAVSCPSHPLAAALSKVPGSNATFTEQLRQFVKQIITDKPGIIEQIRKAHVQLVRPIVAMDRLYRISSTSTGVSLVQFDEAASTTEKWLQDRFMYLTNLVSE